MSYSTLLRISHKIPLLKQSVVKRLGVDDFAFRKGRHYGTILIDLDRHQPIDLLPDRESKTLEDWLRNHPGTELVTRDRSSVYANAITKACPNAVQIADRWHLLANLSQAVERFLDTQRSAINRSLKTSLLTIDSSSAVKPLSEEQLPPFLTWENDLSKLMTMSPTGYTSKRLVMYQKVKQLQAEGHGRRAIDLHLGIARNTVSRYWHQNQFVSRQTPKQSNLLLYEGYLRKRWLEGQTNVKQLLIEIKNFGYNGSYTTLAHFLSAYPRLELTPVLPPARKINSYSSRRICRLLDQPEDEWSIEENAFLTHLLKENEPIRQVNALRKEFHHLMKEKRVDGLAKWCEKAQQLSAYVGFVRGLRQDYTAVEQAFCSHWSNGQTEGHPGRWSGESLENN